MFWQALPHSYYFEQCPSTQSFLLALKKPFSFCRANSQSAGVGQQGRPWYANREQLLFSFSYLFDGDAALHSGLAQLSALSLLTSLKALLPEKKWQLKWPNDVYLDGHKIAGVLIDSIQKKDKLYVVCGIGLNLKHHGDYYGMECEWDADFILNHIMHDIIHAYQIWQHQPYLQDFLRWQQYDMHWGKEINMDNNLSGLHCGIDQKGRLIIKQEHNIHYLSQGRICTSSLM